MKFNEPTEFFDGIARIDVSSLNKNAIEYIDKLGCVVANRTFYAGSPFRKTCLLATVASEENGKMSSYFLLKSGSLVPTDMEFYEPLFMPGDWGKLLPIGANGKVGFCTCSGTLVQSPQWNAVGPSSEGLIAAKENDLWGFLNERADVALPYRYSVEIAPSFHNGLAAVKKDHKFGYIDKSGDFRIARRFDWAGDFHEGIAQVKIGFKRGFINEHGQWICSPKFVLAGDFAEGMAPVTMDAKHWGYIDKTGQYAISPRYESARRFSEGLACVAVDTANGRKYGYINRDGSFVITPTFKDGFDFADGFACVLTETDQAQ